MGGNGLAVLTHGDNNLDTLFPPDSLSYFSNKEELITEAQRLKSNDEERRARGATLRHFFHHEMNNRLHASDIVETSLQLPPSHPYCWRKK